MNAIVIEHVPIADLPLAWRAKLAPSTDAPVTVRIEQEPQAMLPMVDDSFTTDDPAFGLWRDRQDLSDVPAYLRQLRAPRYRRDGDSDSAASEQA